MDNKERYKDFCQEEFSLPIFFRWWWMDAVCGEDSWDVLSISKNNQDIAVLPFYWEKKYGLNSSWKNDSLLDPDSDSLLNIDEYLYGTNPIDNDTDNDRLTDDVEINIYHTNPIDSDSDNDGYYDGQEIENNTDPLNRRDRPGIDDDSFENEEMDDDKSKSELPLFFISLYLILIIVIIIVLFILLILKTKRKNQN